jgi:Asp-tRNA(Asn)/Glu-tRNA(Gln) amidotransferase A subunit family amidase
MDTIGPLARDVAGVVAAMALLEPGFTAAACAHGQAHLARFGGLDTDPRITAAIDAALAEAGLRCETVPIGGWAQAHADGLDLMYGEALEVNRDVLDAGGARLGADVRARFARAAQLGDHHLAGVRARRGVWQGELAAALAGFDALVLPGCPIFPPTVRDLDPASNVAAVAISFAGFPALCLPVPPSDGPPTRDGTPYPASLQLVGPPGSEERLVGIGAAIEACR